MLSRRPFRRLHRTGEWTEGRAVTFVVTLAASFNVTLAAARAGMSRKSAYALRRRDPAFAAAWDEALRAGAKRPASASRGPKVTNLTIPPVAAPQGNNPADRPRDSALRDSFFAALATRTRDLASALLARTRALP